MINVILRNMAKFPLNIHKTQRLNFQVHFLLQLKITLSPYHLFLCWTNWEAKSTIFLPLWGEITISERICSVSREKSGVKLVQKISTSAIKLLFSSNLFVWTCKIYIFSLLSRNKFSGSAAHKFETRGNYPILWTVWKLVKGCLLEMCQEIGLNPRGANKW